MEEAKRITKERWRYGDNVVEYSVIHATLYQTYARLRAKILEISRHCFSIFLRIVKSEIRYLKKFFS